MKPNLQKAIEYYRKNNTMHDTDELAIQCALRMYPGVRYMELVRALETS